MTEPADSTWPEHLQHHPALTRLRISLQKLAPHPESVALKCKALLDPSGADTDSYTDNDADTDVDADAASGQPGSAAPRVDEPPLADA